VASEFSVRPSGGPQPFRRNACLTLQAGELIVTDGKARLHRFPLDKSKGGPALFCTYTVAVTHGSAPEQAVADSHRLAMFRMLPSLWNQDDLRRIADALDLIVSDSLADAPTGDRPDCVDLRGLEGSGRWLILSTLAIILVIAAIIEVLRLVF
jgi:hypothetical protein